MDELDSVLAKENKQARDALKNEPTLQNLLSRMPSSVQESFTEEQLVNLKVALGARS